MPIKSRGSAFFIKLGSIPSASLILSLLPFRRLTQSLTLPFSFPTKLTFRSTFVSPDGNYDSFESIVDDLYPSHLSCFTDGSKGPNYAGAVFCISSLNLSKSYRLIQACSRFTCELFAITMAFYEHHIRPDSLDSRNLIIFSDSFAAVKALKRDGLLSCLHPFEAQIRDLLVKFRGRGIDVVISYIPVHREIVSNLRADSDAKSAATQSIPCFRGVWYKDFFPEFLRSQRDQSFSWCSQYAQSDKGVRYMNLQSDFLCKPWFFGLFMDRATLSMINRIRSNHHRTLWHLHRKGIVAGDFCPCHQECQTLEHLLWRCPRGESGRDAILGFLALFDVTPDSDVFEFVHTKHGLVGFEDCRYFRECSYTI